MKLNDNQKRFLFNTYYIDARVLDSLTYKGWEDYWINNFDFELEVNKNRFNMRTLRLIDKDTKEVSTEFNINLQGNDFETLLKIL
jgi:hypothetical protein